MAGACASAATKARPVSELRPFAKAGSNAQPSAIHDAAVIVFLLWPELFTPERGRISVITDGAEEGRTLFASYAAATVAQLISTINANSSADADTITLAAGTTFGSYTLIN